VSGVLNNLMGVLNVVDIGSLLAPVSGLTGSLGSVSNPTTAVATLTSDPVSTVTGPVGDPTGAVSSVRSTVAFRRGERLASGGRLPAGGEGDPERGVSPLGGGAVGPAPLVLA
jgi:hypothetical protein